MLRIKLGRDPSVEELTDEAMKTRLEREFGTCEPEPMLSTGAKVALGLTALVAAGVAAWKSGLTTALFSGDDSKHADRRHDALPPGNSPAPGANPAPPPSQAPSAQPTATAQPIVVNLPGREYVYRGTDPLELSRFRDLAGVVDRADAVNELQAANAGVDLSKLKAGDKVKIPPGWPDRPSLYAKPSATQAAPPKPSAAPPRPPSPRGPLAALLPAAVGAISPVAAAALPAVVWKLTGAPDAQVPMNGAPATSAATAQPAPPTTTTATPPAPAQPCPPTAATPPAAPPPAQAAGHKGPDAGKIATGVVNTVGAIAKSFGNAVSGGGSGGSPVTSLLSGAANAIGDLGIGAVPDEHDEGA
jgi:hypothetical protein